MALFPRYFPSSADLFLYAGAYLGMAATTDGNGQVMFVLADGDYKFRIDYLGNKFWTSDYTVPYVFSDVLVIDHQDVNITVNEEYGGVLTPLESIPVYLFTSAGAYMGLNGNTDINGQVTFNLPSADYKVRADLLSTQSWSNVFNHTDTTVNIAHGVANVHVFATDIDLFDVPVYLFSENGAYLGRTDRTDSSGLVSLMVPEGAYKFRVDYDGSQVWSAVVNILSDEGTDVEMDLDLLLSEMTLNPNPVRFDGTPPKHSPEKFMLATFGTLTGIIPDSMAGTATEEKVYYFINDHLGTPQAVIDDTGMVVWKADYKPFGEIDITVNGIVNNLRFAGQYYDSESGLHYNYFRYYDPSTGRYLTPDPIGLEGGINLYPYVLNNPVNLIDPYGLEMSDILPGIGTAITEGFKRVPGRSS